MLSVFLDFPGFTMSKHAAKIRVFCPYFNYWNKNVGLRANDIKRLKSKNTTFYAYVVYVTLLPTNHIGRFVHNLLTFAWITGVILKIWSEPEIFFSGSISLEKF